MARLWFKRRRFGWGWSPATKEGWLSVGALLLAVAVAATLLAVTTDDDDAWPVIAYLAFVLVALAIFLRVASQHAPKPHWRWGSKPDDDCDEDY